MKKSLAATIGAALLACGTAHAASVGSGVLSTQIVNNGSTAPVAGKFAKLTVSSGVNTATLATTADINNPGIYRIAMPAAANGSTGPGTTGVVELAITGTVYATFDGTPTAGHYVQLSSTSNGAEYQAGSDDFRPCMASSVVYGVHIMRSSMPLFMVTVVGGGPVTSKWILPVDCAPWGMVAALMLVGLATCHSTR